MKSFNPINGEALLNILKINDGEKSRFRQNIKPININKRVTTKDNQNINRTSAYLHI
jgi:hypothetical protein